VRRLPEYLGVYGGPQWRENVDRPSLPRLKNMVVSLSDLTSQVTGQTNDRVIRECFR
jgi:hypothetical protein